MTIITMTVDVMSIVTTTVDVMTIVTITVDVVTKVTTTVDVITIETTKVDVMTTVTTTEVVRATITTDINRYGLTYDDSRRRDHINGRRSSYSYDDIQQIKHGFEGNMAVHGLGSPS